MSITSGKVIVLTGLAALALVACGGDDGSLDGYSIATGATAGAGGQGGEMLVFEVEKIPCASVTPDHIIKGFTGDKPSFDEEFRPSEVTMKVGEVVQFMPDNTAQNMESGVYPVKDGKFHLQQGAGGCLRTNVPGTYPFFSLGAPNPMNGTLYVLP